MVWISERHQATKKQGNSLDMMRMASFFIAVGYYSSLCTCVYSKITVMYIVYYIHKQKKKLHFFTQKIDPILSFGCSIFPCRSDSRASNQICFSFVEMEEMCG